VTGPIRGLDHVIIGVHDLEGARADWMRLGFVTAPRGDHVGKATSNYCIMFPDTYLELLGILRPEMEDANGLGAALLTRGEGLQRLALGTSDADAARADLEAAGLHPQGPFDLSRPSEEPKGVVRFRNLMLPKSDTADLGMFLCGHKTPELMRTPDWIAHPNGACAFVGITALVRDPAVTAAELGRIFGAPAVSETAYGHRINTGNGVIRLTTLDAFSVAHPGASAPMDIELPVWYALTLAVTSTQTTADLLARNGVPFDRVDEGLRVLPSSARGVLLEFTSA